MLFELEAQYRPTDNVINNDVELDIWWQQFVRDMMAKQSIAPVRPDIFGGTNEGITILGNDNIPANN